MAIYSPSNNDNDKGQPKEETDPLKQTERFYIRPSLGLKLWGPLVPASDNRTGLWTLVGIQTAFGLFCLHRFRKLVNHSLITAANKAKQQSFNTVKNIADIPTLNRFSTTHKVLVINNPQVTTIPLQTDQPIMGTNNNNSNQGNGKRNSSSSQSARFAMLKKILYLISGTALLSQSMLEFCRLKILKYDPWYEEARTARDKKFFNDIVQFYHEGIDPNEVKVTDVVNGNIMSTNMPEVRQSVALVRAQAESQNPIIKWYGPIEFQPMSFSEYLDQMEYYLEMSDLLIKKKKYKKLNKNSDNPLENGKGPVSLLSLISHTDEEYKQIQSRNKQIRDDILNNSTTNIEVTNTNDGNVNGNPTDAPPVPEYQKSAPSNTNSILPMRGILLDARLQESQQIDLNEIWSLYDPWMNLGLETSLSIKFIPTVLQTNQTGESVSQTESRDNSDQPSEESSEDE